MINDIAAQFGYLPGERAAQEIANHVLRFWDPRMRDRLTGGSLEGMETLTPAARAAVDQLRATAHDKVR